MKTSFHGKYRLSNVSPTVVSFHNFNHCFSASIVEENETEITIKIDSLLDPRDHDQYGKLFTIPIKEFSRMQGSLTKI